MAGEPGWTVTDYLLANVVDVLAISNWLYVAAHSGKNASNPKPKPVPRFGERSEGQESEAVEVGPDALASFLGLSVMTS